MIEFEEGISTPENWLRQAWQLFAAARVLHQSMDGASSPMSELETYREVGTIKAIMLLMGLAVENALKGALIHKQPPDTSAGRLKSSHFQDNGQAHDLVAIAQKLDLPITQEYRTLLERLTIFVQWAAKYQTPLRKSAQARAAGNLYMEPSTDLRLVEALIKELERHAGYGARSGWPIPE